MSLIRATAVALAVSLSGVGENIAEASAGTLVRGDLNQDGQVTLADGSAMAHALADPIGYQTAHGFDQADLQDVGDINGDGLFDNQDIGAFLTYENNLNGDGHIGPQSHQPAMLYFSTSATNPGAVSPSATNPTNAQLTIQQGSSANIYIWAQVNDLEAISGLSLGVTSTLGSVVTATGSTIFNPTNGSFRHQAVINQLCPTRWVRLY